jgi:hypothetical protein
MPRRLTPIAEGPTMAGACGGYPESECVPNHSDFCYWKASTNKCTSRPMQTFMGKRPASAKQKAAANKPGSWTNFLKAEAAARGIRYGDAMVNEDVRAKWHAKKAQKGGYRYY